MLTQHSGRFNKHWWQQHFDDTCLNNIYKLGSFQQVEDSLVNDIEIFTRSHLIVSFSLHATNQNIPYVFFDNFLEFLL